MATVDLMCKIEKDLNRRTIAILTSGGDAPGMNAVVRAVVRVCNCQNIRVLGVRRGYVGLMEGDMYEMSSDSVCGILQKGGTILFSARSHRFNSADGIADAVDVCNQVGIEGIVCVGGDGTFKGARDLAKAGINVVGVPGTIDNDISCCDYTIGFNTALTTVQEMVDRIRDTSESHRRCTLVEVMGRNAGYLALDAAISVGAVSVLVPEIDFDVDKDIVERVVQAKLSGKFQYIVIVAEGVKPMLAEKGFASLEALQAYIQEKTGVESRTCILGHVQRGGIPTVTDRLVGTRMGAYAAELLIRHKQGEKLQRVVAIQKDVVMDFDITEALAMTKSLDKELYRIAYGVGI